MWKTGSGGKQLKKKKKNRQKQCTLYWFLQMSCLCQELGKRETYETNIITYSQGCPPCWLRGLTHTQTPLVYEGLALRTQAGLPKAHR